MDRAGPALDAAPNINLAKGLTLPVATRFEVCMVETRYVTPESSDRVECASEALPYRAAL